VSVVQQNAGEDMDCSDKMCSLFKNAEVCAKRKAQVRTYNVPSTEAKGPVFARALASRMVMPDSQFCMQIDSHMDFAPGWENHLLEFWCSTKNEYAVLSTYVADMRQLGKCVNGQFEVPHLCQVYDLQGGLKLWVVVKVKLWVCYSAHACLLSVNLTSPTWYFIR